MAFSLIIAAHFQARIRNWNYNSKTCCKAIFLSGFQPSMVYVRKYPALPPSPEAMADRARACHGVMKWSRDLQPACTGLTAYGAFSPFCPFRADYFCRAYSLNGLYDLIPSAARSTGSLAKLFTEHYNTVKCPEGAKGLKVPSEHSPGQAPWRGAQPWV